VDEGDQVLLLRRSADFPAGALSSTSAARKLYVPFLAPRVSKRSLNCCVAAPCDQKNSSKPFLSSSTIRRAETHIPRTEPPSSRKPAACRPYVISSSSLAMGSSERMPSDEASSPSVPRPRASRTEPIPSGSVGAAAAYTSLVAAAFLALVVATFLVALAAGAAAVAFLTVEPETFGIRGAVISDVSPHCQPIEA
jgi:hypothetical protein